MLKGSIAAVVAALVAALLFHASSNAQTSAAQVHAGQLIFQKSCLPCHATTAGQYSFGPNLAGELKAPHPKKTNAEVRQLIKNGKGKMPAFGEKLTAADTDSLIAYLHTL